MRKLIVFSATALLAGALAGGAQATPLSATGAMAMSGIADQSMPDQGVIKARWHQRHYGVAAITTAGAIIIRTGMRITGVPGISRVNSAWNIDDWALPGSSTRQARRRAPIGLPDNLQPLLDNAAQILAWQRREFLIALAAALQGIPTIGLLTVTNAQTPTAARALWRLGVG
jgi:hypothetical protein